MNRLSPEPTPLIFGLEGPQLTDQERFFFERVNPLGFILFRWNIETPEQVKTLIKTLKETVERDPLPVLVDAEGGRVFRLPDSFCPKPPASRFFGELYKQDPQKALSACAENARAIGHKLRETGFTVNCSPLLDLDVPGAHNVIGDRSFGADAAVVALLGKAVREGLEAAGIVPVIKHLPGHGGVSVDSHDAPAIITLSQAELQPHWIPFRANADAAWGMTAHIVYSALDPTQPASFSPFVIEEIIRGFIGFKGLLLSDDLYMNAVSGSPSERVTRALRAGCDAVLYCRGGLDTFQKAVQDLPAFLKGYRPRLDLSREALPTLPVSSGSPPTALEKFLGAV